VDPPSLAAGGGDRRIGVRDQLRDDLRQIDPGLREVLAKVAPTNATVAAAEKRQSLRVQDMPVSRKDSKATCPHHHGTRGASVIDHINIGVSDLGRSRAFYERALAPLGIAVVMEHRAGVGLGDHGKPYFWISDRARSAPLHVAFASPDRATVDAFHAEALAAGGRDNGPAGLRPQYHPSYYGAFALDPDGNNVEAVCHGPE
jgi:catechol 2,3-dioxygenase-like lactoylglutathione lyase family enzyme